MTGDPVNFCWICDRLFDTYMLSLYEGEWVCFDCIEENSLDTEECLCVEHHNWKLEGF